MSESDLSSFASIIRSITGTFKEGCSTREICSEYREVWGEIPSHLYGFTTLEALLSSPQMSDTVQRRGGRWFAVANEATRDMLRLVQNTRGKKKSSRGRGGGAGASFRGGPSHSFGGGHAGAARRRAPFMAANKPAARPKFFGSQASNNDARNTYAGNYDDYDRSSPTASAATVTSPPRLLQLPSQKGRKRLMRLLEVEGGEATLSEIRKSYLKQYGCPLDVHELRRVFSMPPDEPIDEFELLRSRLAEYANVESLNGTIVLTSIVDADVDYEAENGNGLNEPPVAMVDDYFSDNDAYTNTAAGQQDRFADEDDELCAAFARSMPSVDITTAAKNAFGVAGSSSVFRDGGAVGGATSGPISPGSGGSLADWHRLGQDRNWENVPKADFRGMESTLSVQQNWFYRSREESPSHGIASNSTREEGTNRFTRSHSPLAGKNYANNDSRSDSRRTPDAWPAFAAGRAPMFAERRSEQPTDTAERLTYKAIGEKIVTFVKANGPLQISNLDSFFFREHDCRIDPSTYKEGTWEGVVETIIAKGWFPQLDAYNNQVGLKTSISRGVPKEPVEFDQPVQAPTPATDRNDPDSICQAILRILAEEGGPVASIDVYTKLKSEGSVKTKKQFAAALMNLLGQFSDLVVCTFHPHGSVLSLSKNGSAGEATSAKHRQVPSRAESVASCRSASSSGFNVCAGTSGSASDGLGAEISHCLTDKVVTVEGTILDDYRSTEESADKMFKAVIVTDLSYSSMRVNDDLHYRFSAMIYFRDFRTNERDEMHRRISKYYQREWDDNYLMVDEIRNGEVYVVRDSERSGVFYRAVAIVADSCTRWMRCLDFPIVLDSVPPLTNVRSLIAEFAVKPAFSANVSTAPFMLIETMESQFHSTFSYAHRVICGSTEAVLGVFYSVPSRHICELRQLRNTQKNFSVPLSFQTARIIQDVPPPQLNEAEPEARVRQ